MVNRKETKSKQQTEHYTDNYNRGKRFPKQTNKPGVNTNVSERKAVSAPLIVSVAFKKMCVKIIWAFLKPYIPELTQ